MGETRLPDYQLTKRQEMLLGLIVHEYVSVPVPVSSKQLVDSYEVKVSSATVRNDMAVLEEAGLIKSPHTSAGRIPTDTGYRYFVRRIIRDTDLSYTEQRTIQHQFHQASLDVEKLLRLAASVLASTVRSASLVTSPVLGQALLKHIELIQTHGRAVLMVLVIEGGTVRQQMLTFSEPISQEVLTTIAADINKQCGGKNADQIMAWGRQQDLIEKEVVELIVELLRRAGSHSRLVVHDGLVNILDPHTVAEQMELPSNLHIDEIIKVLDEVDSGGARQALRLLEEHSLLEEITTDVLSEDVDTVHVMIAGEGRWSELNQTSIVLSRYGVSGLATGAVGVLGPVRLRYGRAISTVRYVAGLMSELMVEIYGTGKDGN